MTANGAPIVAEALFGSRLGQPVDAGMRLPDGHRLFGCSKTWRGILAAILTTAAIAYILDLSSALGALVGLSAMLGDLCASFTKRRMGLAPSSQAIGLDQIPEALFPTLILAPVYQLETLDILAIIILFTVLELAISRPLYRLKIRKRPY